MEVKIRKKTITSNSIFKIMWPMILIATIAQMTMNVLADRNLITGMVIF